MAFDALWKTLVTGDIPTEVLHHLPERCVTISTPEQTWQGATLQGFFNHVECDMNDRRTELRLALDVTGPAGDHLRNQAWHVMRKEGSIAPLGRATQALASSISNWVPAPGSRIDTGTKFATVVR